MIPLEPESDLHWMAFLYVSGDLSPEEATRFETRLAEDQDARVAVIQAVDLADALAIVGREEAISPRRKRGRRVLLAALSLAAAACLTLAILPAFRSIRPPQAYAADVAQAWSGIRGGADAEWMASIDDSHETEPVNQIPDSVTSTERALPSWLLSAASAPRNDAPQEEN